MRFPSASVPFANIIDSKCSKGRGQEKSKEIKNLSLKAVPLRYVDILLDYPIFVEENGIQIQIPSPASFAAHKIIISQRRTKPEKKAKDLEQALSVLEAIDLEEFINIFNSFPNPWKKKVLSVLSKSKRPFPLKQETIQKVLLTLQTKKKRKV